MPKTTFWGLPDKRRDRLVHEAIAEFANRTYAEASLSQIALRAQIAKGSFYQYFDDKLDLYRWLLTEEVPRRKREFIGTADTNPDFWVRLETLIERGMAFLVAHPQLARLSAAAADPTALVEVRGLHKAICDAGHQELQALLSEGVKSGALPPDVDLAIATHLVAACIGPGLTDAVLRELGAELHEVLASDSLRRRLGPRLRRRLARAATSFIRTGLETRARQ